MKTKTILCLAIILVTLGLVFYLINIPRTDEDTPDDSDLHVWDVNEDDIAHIVITLPREGLSEAFIKKGTGWYFDTADGPKVNPERWAGDIPLLLSGPQAYHLITEEPTAEQLTAFGFSPPRMEITLTLVDSTTVNIEGGDTILDGSAYYIKLADSSTVYTVGDIWYTVIENLAFDPPYPPEESE